jgi:hypothetical protein
MQQLFKPELFVVLIGLYVLFILFHSVLNRMASVPHPLRCAFALLIVPGVFGKVMGAAVPAAGRCTSTSCCSAGIALLFTVDRRGLAAPSSARWRTPARVAAIGALIVGGLACSAVHAQQDGPRIQVASTQGCARFAIWVQNVGDFRDAGAELGRVLKVLARRNEEQPAAVRAIMAAEVRRVFQDPDTSADDLAGDAFERCVLGLLKP